MIASCPSGVICGEPVGGPAGDVHHRLAGAQVADRHVLPGDAHAQAGAERLGARLLRGPALGVGAGHVAAALGLALLGLGEDAVAETVAETVERALDALDVAQVGADAEDHRALPRGAETGNFMREFAPQFQLLTDFEGGMPARAASIRRRISAMAGVRPRKIASPIRKWPMFSSTTCGIAAMGATVS